MTTSDMSIKRNLDKSKCAMSEADMTFVIFLYDDLLKSNFPH